MAGAVPEAEPASEKPATDRPARTELPSALRPVDLFRRREAQPPDPTLSFYQRHFTRSIVASSAPSSTSSGSFTDSTRSATHEKTAEPLATTTAPHIAPGREFNALSRGAILSFLLLAAVFIAVLVPVLVTQLAKHDTRTTQYTEYGSNSRQGQNITGHPVSPESSGDPLAYQYSKPPLRLAVLANFPDPSIHYDINSSLWYAFATNNGAGVLQDPGQPISPTDPSIRTGSNVQVATSTDFLTWTLRDAASDALPTVGAWARQGNNVPTAPANGNDVAPGLAIQGLNLPLANVWAPDMIQHPSRPNTYLFYYAAVAASDPKHHHCIGAATATTPDGPYTPVAEALACPTDLGGAIDAVAAVDVDDDNAIYIAYKIDGNSLGNGGECGNTVPPLASTPIMLQRMAADGITPAPATPPIQLLDRTDVDGPLIEAPALVKAGSTWFLFYSSGCTRNPSYDVRYATAPHITGPYTRNPVPLLATGDFDLLAPGSVSVRWSQDGVAGGTAAAALATNETLGGGWKIAVHARVKTVRGGVRAAFTAGLDFRADGSVALVAGPI